MGVWVEIVTLLVPGFNDAEDELKRLTAFVAGVSPDIPWHVTAFHADYKMTDPPDTTPEMLLRAASLGREAGLRFVYAGNIPGGVGEFEDTRCPSCGKTLVARRGYLIRSYAITTDGRCPSCRTPIPGRWSEQVEDEAGAHPLRFIWRR
jgi:pyruvate formate lyase activating enzyme